MIVGTLPRGPHTPSLPPRGEIGGSHSEGDFFSPRKFMAYGPVVYCNRLWLVFQCAWRSAMLSPC